MSSNDLTLQSEPWRVRCTRHGDRLFHEIDCWWQQRWLTVLISEEGEPDQAWPTSPPIQQLVLDRLGESHSDESLVLLGVGMAGTSHWSVSIHVEAATHRLILDVACRFTALPVQLGSTYRLAPELRAAQSAKSSGESIEMISISDNEPIGTLVSTEIGKWSLDGSVVRLEPIPPIATNPGSSNGKATTSRWMGCISVDR